ncbi:fungal-specific transcription factor domain-containing protein [Xylogone sp. PMI_703]|nr:fungal-specific transcription factor domain-containing protein [Xylogone sp. PMI_703]
MAKAPKTGGCWTCRLRHVKCDEGSPTCLQCNIRCITCHGYGPKPAWMNGGQREIEIKRVIKDTIKKNIKQQKRTRNHVSKGHDRNHIQDRLHERESSSPLQDAIMASLSAQDVNSEEIQRNVSSSPKEIQEIDPLQTHQLKNRSFAEPLSYKESSLLMYYLDHVFPMQYPYYRKGTWDRGWLLWLLSKNGPLYRTSIGLAALHRCSLTGEKKEHGLELQHHTRALRELQNFIGHFDTDKIRDDNDTLAEIVSCSVALISFEVLRGSTNNWQAHLFAMTSLINSMNLPLRNSTSLPQPSSDSFFKRKIHAALEFYIPVVLWMDILACVATRQKPKLLYDELLHPDNNFNLANVMGCQNWIMKAIGDLGVLNEWKLDALASNSFDCNDFNRGAQIIEDNLEDGIEILHGVINQAAANANDSCISLIFAAAALVQLHILSTNVLLSCSSSRLRRAVSWVIFEIQTAQHTPSARQIAWPICIAGCVAEADQRCYLEVLITDALHDTNGMNGNCGTVLDIMRYCWTKQIEQPDVQWDCSRAMTEMDISALLI